MDEEQQKFYRYWLERAMNLLMRREHSIIELRQKLLQRDCESDLADKIITECVDKNYLNLERFADVFARHQAKLGYGSKKVEYLLRQHEIPQEFISVAMAETDFVEAKEIALRKIGDKTEIKIKSALYRRGF